MIVVYDHTHISIAYLKTVFTIYEYSLLLVNGLSILSMFYIWFPNKSVGLYVSTKQRRGKITTQ
jgi:hypothetical protein